MIQKLKSCLVIAIFTCGVPTLVAAALTPEQTFRAFYDLFLSSKIDYKPQWQGQVRSFLTPYLQAFDEDNSCGANYVVKGQDCPEAWGASYSLFEKKQAPGSDRAEVLLDKNRQAFTYVQLIRQDGTWKIDALRLPKFAPKRDASWIPAQKPAPGTPAHAVENFYQETIAACLKNDSKQERSIQQRSMSHRGFAVSELPCFGDMLGHEAKDTASLQILGNKVTGDAATLQVRVPARDWVSTPFQWADLRVEMQSINGQWKIDQIAIVKIH
jgi:hypothetical protein